MKKYIWILALLVSAVALADYEEILQFDRGGTSKNTRQLAIDALANGVVSGTYLRGNGTHDVMSTIQAGDIPAIDLTSMVSGILPILNGGTGQSTQQAAINALVGGVTSGDFLRCNGTNCVLNTIQLADTIFAPVALGGTAINWALGDAFTQTIVAPTTYTFSGLTAGQVILATITDAGSNAIHFPGGIIWAGGSEPTASTANAYTFYYDGINTYGSVVQPTAGGGFSSPMTTLGDTLYENATPAAARLPGNITTTREFYSETGNGSISAAPAWGVLLSGDIPNNAANTSGTAAVATNLSGGLGGSIPYQSAVNTTAMLANGTAGQFLQSNGTTLAPSWASAGAGHPNIKAVYTISTNETYTSGQQINFDHQVVDVGCTGNCVTAGSAGSSGTWKFTYPASAGDGFCTVFANAFGATSGQTQGEGYDLYKNGSNFIQYFGFSSNIWAAPSGATTQFEVSPGDYFDVRWTLSTTIGGSATRDLAGMISVLCTQN